MDIVKKFLDVLFLSRQEDLIAEITANMKKTNQKSIREKNYIVITQTKILFFKLVQKL